MKKILTLALAGAMALSMGVVAFATNASFNFTTPNGTVAKGARPSVKFLDHTNEFRNGYETSITFDLNPESFTHGELFEYSVSVRDLALADVATTATDYLTEVVASFQKNDSANGIVWMKCGPKNPNIVITQAGNYTLTHKYVNNNGKLRAIVTLRGMNINESVTIDYFGGNIEGNEEPDITRCGFVRYLWFVQVQANNGVKVTSWSAPTYLSSNSDNSPEDNEPTQAEIATETAKTETAETVAKVETVADEIKAITGGLPVAVAGTANAEKLEKICKEAGLKVATAEVDGKKTVAPVISLDLGKMEGKLSYTINDMLAGSGLFLELKGTDGKIYMIPTASLKKSEPNRIYFTETYLINLAINK